MNSLRDDARAIWQAGVDAVDSTNLVRNAISASTDALTIAGHRFDLSSIERICVVGAGKAGAGMAAGVEQALGPELLDRISGWVNVPADCVKRLKRITLHAARPAGVNEPTAAGVEGTQAILKLVGELTRNDLCIVLLSGGGSALLPGPAAPITLDEKLAVTRKLAAAGATIQELNTVRKQLSTVKGGRLAADIPAGQVVTLIISDIVGDPIDMIASGPTVPDRSTVAEAEEILRRLLQEEDVPASVWERLRSAGTPPTAAGHVHNEIIGSNRVAVAAALAEARRRGYDVKDIGSSNDGEAADWGRTLAEAALDARKRHTRPFCLIGGGETTVRLPRGDQPRKGGRNQEIALAAVTRFWDEPAHGVVVLSGGTDGEDGPTDAAGAIADLAVITEAKRKRLDPQTFLAEHSSYWFFEAAGGLLRTGPTHTNVMDLHVVISTPRPKRAWVPEKEWATLREQPAPADRPRRRTAKTGRRG